jgi:predicted enzyme related to lactoylglutathione lyase
MMGKPVVHFEIGCRDQGRTAEFYGKLFDWKMSPMGPAYLDKAVKLGGKMLVPPVPIPTGTFAWMQDPEGNTEGLWKPAAK